MKVLFGLVKDASTTIEDKILDAYKLKYNNEFTYKKEYYIAGISKALEEQEFNVLVLYEKLENTPVNTAYIDSLTDKYTNLKVIFVIDATHRNDDFPKSLFALGIYNGLFKDDLKIDNIIQLIHSDRSKRDAKEYYGIDESSDLNIMPTGITTIPDDELDTVLDNFASSTIENIGELFGLAEKTYEFSQVVYLLSLLGDETKELISSTCPKEYSKYKKALEREIKKVEIQEKIVETVKVVEKIVEKPVEKIKIEKQYIDREVIKEVYEKPSDYKKVIAFVGPSNAGATTIIDNMSKILANNNVKVGIVDLKNNKDFYERYIFNEEIKWEPLSDLLTGLIKPYKISNNVSLYTNAVTSYQELEQHLCWRIIDLVRKDNDVTLIDMNTTDIENVYPLVDRIQVVTTQDLTEVKYITSVIHKLVDSKVVDESSSKFDFIINKYISDKKCLSSKELLDCYMHHIEDYCSIDNPKKMIGYIDSKILEVNFDIEILKANYSSDYKCTLSEAHKADIEQVINSFYKINSINQGKSIFGKIKNILK